MPAPMVAALVRAEMAKPGVLTQASRQVASVTPKFSSICSERSQPGVTPTAVTGWSLSSALRPVTMRSTLALTRS
jgi:hypothetical protein